MEHALNIPPISVPSPLATALRDRNDDMKVKPPEATTGPATLPDDRRFIGPVVSAKVSTAAEGEESSSLQPDQIDLERRLLPFGVPMLPFVENEDQGLSASVMDAGVPAPRQTA